MKLTNKIKIIELEKRSSKHDFWKNLALDDIVEVATEFEARSCYGGQKVPDVTLTNLRTNDSYTSTMNRIITSLQRTKYEEVV